MSYYEEGIDKVAANNIFLSSILIDIVYKILLYHLIRLILIYNGFMIINLNFYSIFIRLTRHRTSFMPGLNLRTSVNCHRFHMPLMYEIQKWGFYICRCYIYETYCPVCRNRHFHVSKWVYLTALDAFESFGLFHKSLKYMKI